MLFPTVPHLSHHIGGRGNHDSSPPVLPFYHPEAGSVLTQSCYLSPATTPGPSSSTAAAWAVEKILSKRTELMNTLLDGLEDEDDDDSSAEDPDETLPAEWMDWERLTSIEDE